MQEFTLSDGNTAIFNRVGDYAEVKILIPPSLELTNQLCLINEYLDSIKSAKNILVTLDTVSFKSDLPQEKLISIIETIDIRTTSRKSKEICIEINYNGRDINYVCDALALAKKELIELHTTGKYYVAMMGFLPGFPYIGGLPSQLHLPRKSQADKMVPRGSVAIAMQYTGIYPQQSPGGWHILGHTTFNNFEVHTSSLFKLSVGDRIRFKSLGI